MREVRLGRIGSVRIITARIGARRSRMNQRGFTLAELILVTLLLGMMSVVMFGSLSGMKRSAEYVANRQGDERTMQVIMERLTREIASACEVRLYTPKNTSKQQGQGQAGAQLVVIEGLNQQEGNTDTDSLRFVSFNGSQAFYGAQQNFGPVEIRYFLTGDVQDRGRNASSGNAGNNTGEGYALVREEYPASAPSADSREKNKIIFPIAYNVQAINFRYLKNDQWSEQWTAVPARQLPDAIEIAVALGESATAAKVYKTLVAIDGRRK